jgi:hypothetical protein
VLCRDNEGIILSGNGWILGRWVEHFDELLNTNVFDQWEDMATIESQENPVIAEPVLAISGVEEAIEKLKNNKAPGMDLIQAELVKYVSPEYIKHLHKFTVKIWFNETFPEEWNLSIICCIHKKGDVMICSKHRGISLLFTTYRIFSNILFNRLAPM